jgi:hypothetical protein
MARKIKVTASLPRVTQADYQRMDTIGIRIVWHQAVAEAGYWLPGDMIGTDGKTLIRWHPAGQGPVAYGVDGWHTWHDGMSGGCYTHVSSALAWVERARDIRAGLKETFLGT